MQAGVSGQPGKCGAKQLLLHFAAFPKR
jgi:hypothetical protein